MDEVRAFLDFKGRRASGATIKAVVPQIDGSTFGTANCAAASEAMRVIIQQQGKRPAKGRPWPPSGASIREATRSTKETGLSESQVRTVSSKRYGIAADVRIVQWPTVLKKLRAGHAAKFLHSYGPIADEPRRNGAPPRPGKRPFRGNHSSVLVGIRGTGPAIEILVADPLYDGRRAGIPKGPQWIRIGVLKKAANQLVMNTAGSTLRDLRGPGHAYVSFTLTKVMPAKEAESPVPAGVVIRRGARRLRKPRTFKLLFNRTNVRATPRKGTTGVVRLADRGDLFDAFQWTRNRDGKWIGNRTGDEWLFFPGVKFDHFLKGVRE